MTSVRRRKTRSRTTVERRPNRTRAAATDSPPSPPEGGGGGGVERGRHGVAQLGRWWCVVSPRGAKGNLECNATRSDWHHSHGIALFLHYLGTTHGAHKTTVLVCKRTHRHLECDLILRSLRPCVLGVRRCLLNTRLLFGFRFGGFGAGSTAVMRDGGSPKLCHVHVVAGWSAQFLPRAFAKRQI